MSDISGNVYDALMSEYKSLRGEIVVYSQRADATINIYLSVLVAVAAYVVTMAKDSAFNWNVMMSDPWGTGAVVLLGIINSMVMLRLQTFYIAAIAMAQYSNEVVRPRIRKLLGNAAVLDWDQDGVVSIKAFWLQARSNSQRAFALLSSSGTVATIVLAWPVAQIHWGLWIPIAISALLLLLVVKIGFQFREAASIFKKSTETANTQPSKDA